MKWVRAIVGLMAAGSVAVQYITPSIDTAPTWSLIYTIRYFSYFTILSNLLLAFVLLVPLISNAAFARWLDSAAVRAAAVLYLAITGLIYFALLRHTWNPTGLTYYADRSLHYVVPCLASVEWWLFAAKRGLSRHHLLRWLIFPTFYFCFLLAQGAITGFYPYNFFDVARHGYQAVLLSGVGILFLFSAVGALLVKLSRLRGH